MFSPSPPKNFIKQVHLYIQMLLKKYTCYGVLVWGPADTLMFRDSVNDGIRNGNLVWNSDPLAQIFKPASFNLHRLSKTVKYEKHRLSNQNNCWSQCSRGLRRRSVAAGLLGLQVRIPPRAWTSVSCECSVLSSKYLCDGLILRPGESYPVCYVCVCVMCVISKPRYWGGLGQSRVLRHNKSRYQNTNCLVN